MNQKKTILIIIIVSAILFFLRKRIEWVIYDLQEYYRVNNSLTWNENKKLKWSDFKYAPDKNYADNIFASVGVSQRYHIDDKIEFRSRSLFIPEKSFVTDTLNSLALRIAQAKFDLCEVYRRKLESQVEKLRKNVNEVTTDTLKGYGEKYNKQFENQWSDFMNLEQSQVEKGLIDLEKQIKLELKTKHKNTCN